jgi:hypothetical protein
VALTPKNKVGKIEFFQSKLTPWTDNATALGTSSAAVTALGTKVTAAQNARAAQIIALAAAETATATLDNAIEQMMIAGMDIVKDIRATAASAPNPQVVYDLAQIPAPATPQPVTTLGTPGNFKAKLNGNGDLITTWKCASPRASGTVYQVYRRIGGTGEFTYLGGCGTKKFVDTTIPAGATQVTYQIQAVRSTAVGEWAQFNVNFGTGSSGAMTASVSEPSPKLAA